MDFTLTLTEKPQILALQGLTDAFNKLRDEKSQVDMQGYLQEVLNGMVYSSAAQYDVALIDKQIAILQDQRDAVTAAPDVVEEVAVAKPKVIP